jgi:hypothetical protein
MKYLILIIITISLRGVLIGQIEYKYINNETYTYEEVTNHYFDLAKRNETAQIIEVGISDVGKPIHLFVISKDKDFDFKSIETKGRGVVLINNAIHSGEPCGVDASLKLADDLLHNKKHEKLLERTVVCIIPFYNVGGGLNRSCCSRTNQNGPKEYGFRGNKKNRDLNRDFIKCDTKNSLAFINAYHMCNPDIFIDTHTTNGSDFQYTLSLIATQPDKLEKELSNCLKNDLLPFLYEDMTSKSKEIIPYVYLYKKTPDDGIKDFLETPRYSTGYTALFNTIGFVTEALKYKPYQDRVEHTYDFLFSTLKWMKDNVEQVKLARKKANQNIINKTSFDLAWKLDTSSFIKIDFKGYEREYIPSEFGNNEKLLIYNHEKPTTKTISYYNKYVATVKVDKPSAYLIPQAYTKVIDNLKLNRIELSELEKDTLIEVDVYYIKDYKTVDNPYEGHYLHYGVNVDVRKKMMQFYKGDIIVKTNQVGNRYIIETLEPQGVDSYFAWNYFDGILQQKEWFSAFSFEATAKELLLSDKNLRAKFDKKKADDSEFAKSRKKQLHFIYINSPYYEDSHNQYPVVRVN